MTATTTEKTYKIVGGTFYSEKTPGAVIQWLETSRERRQRIRIFYGDVATGRDWQEEYDTRGTVGRSTGRIKIPLLIPNARSTGGGAILDDCIVRIMTADSVGVWRNVYQHRNYVLPAFTVKRNIPFSEYPVLLVDNDGRDCAAFKTASQAIRWAAFMRGERQCK